MKREKIEEIAELMINAYKHGFGKPSPYKILRENIRDLFGIDRIEGNTLKLLDSSLREEGYLLTPIDTNNYSKAQMWIVQRYSTLTKHPLADEKIVGGWNYSRR